MSRTETIIGVSGLVLAGICAWDVLDKRNLVTTSILIGSWLFGAGMLIFSCVQMMRDIVRAKRITAVLESERRITASTVASLQVELRKRQERLEQEAIRHKAQIETLKEDHRGSIEALKALHAENIKTARRTVIRSALWGLNSPYTCDQTAMLQFLLDRGTPDLRASTDYFPDNFPGDAKRLAVEYFSPFSARIERHTFREGEEIDFAKLAQSSTQRQAASLDSIS